MAARQPPNSMLEMVVLELLKHAEIVNGQSRVVPSDAGRPTWQLLCRRFAYLRDTGGDGPTVARKIVGRGCTCVVVNMLPPTALHCFLGYAATTDTHTPPHNVLFADMWDTITQAGAEVWRLLALARRHTELAVGAVTKAKGVLDNKTRNWWLKKFGRNEAERSRLNDMLERMGCGIDEGEPTHEVMFCLRHGMDIRGHARTLTVAGGHSRVAAHCSNVIVRSWLDLTERAAKQEHREDITASRASGNRNQKSSASVLSSATSMAAPLPVRLPSAGGNCAACRGMHRSHTCKAQPRTGKTPPRKRSAAGSADPKVEAKRAKPAKTASVAGVAALPSNSLEFVGMIWELMTKLDLSQTALGAQCGLSQQQLSRW